MDINPASPSQNWWSTAVGYEVYIRSFADGNGDGIGDLPGLTSKLDYLAWLGIDVLWITPFYRSPMADYGYDVADYVGIDPMFGTLDDFDRLLAKAHQLGLKVVVDIVPNHSSSQHEWFQKALADPASQYRDYYHFRDAPADGSLPNNWVGYFGGPTWTLDEASGQYYLHMFLPEQPDLNWDNPDVHAEFETILRFWLDRGVDGFRIDVAQAMGKDAALRSNPELKPVDHNAFRWEQWEAFEHRHDVLQSKTHEIFRSWKAITDDYAAVLIGETYVLEPDEFNTLVGPPSGLDIGFWFKTMHMDWSANEIRSVLGALGPEVSGKVGWVQASHDEHRPPTRFGGGDLGRQRSLCLAILLLGMPGMPFLYQGEELGLEDGVVPPEAKMDPIGEQGDATSGRDGCRTPIPWDDSDHRGFTTGTSTWLPISHTVEDTVAYQRDRQDSWLSKYRELISVRRDLLASRNDVRQASAELIDLGQNVIAIKRGSALFLVNFGSEPIELPDGNILFRTDDNSLLGADSAAVIAT